MKLFLTGSTGFIGSHLLLRLQMRGHEVVTDMRYFEDRYDAIINLAAVTHIRNEFDPQMIESNIILTDKIFKRPERIIQASSCSAAHFTNPYAWTKMWSEYLVKKHGNAVGLRFHNVYGPYNNKGIVWFLMNQPNGSKITIRGPELVRDYIYIDDVVNLIIGYLKDSAVYVDMKVLQELSNQFTAEQLMSMTFERNVVLGDSFKIDAAKGIIDIGTGIGTETMDVVNLYQKLSGKNFDISIAVAGDNEPSKMVSDKILLKAITLEQGLSKMITN